MEHDCHQSREDTCDTSFHAFWRKVSTKAPRVKTKQYLVWMYFTMYKGGNAKYLAKFLSLVVDDTWLGGVAQIIDRCFRKFTRCVRVLAGHLDLGITSADLGFAKTGKMLWIIWNPPCCNTPPLATDFLALLPTTLLYLKLYVTLITIFYIATFI